jgi:hypothetical protein
VQADDFTQRQNVCAAQVVIRIGRRKAIKMRAANRHEEQRVRLLCDFIAQTGINFVRINFGCHALFLREAAVLYIRSWECLTKSAYYHSESCPLAAGASEESDVIYLKPDSSLRAQ